MRDLESELDTSIRASIGEMSPKFACDTCGKSFTQKQSQTRHSSYCRTKSRNPPRIRKKSCVACTKAKTYCDITLPACSRCIEKNLACIYEHLQHSESPQVHSTDQNVHVVGPSSERSTISTYPQNPVPLRLTNDEVDIEQIPYQDFSAVLGIPRVASFQISQNWPPFIDSSVNTVSRDSGFGSQRSAVLLQRQRPQTKTFPFSDSRNQTGLSGLQVIASPRRQPVLRPPRAFWPKKLRTGPSSLTSKYVISTLKAYPLMLRPGKSLPPFIHPNCLVEERGPNGREYVITPQGPLAACSGITSMWSAKNKDNNNFMWRAVQMEQERLLRECFSYNDSDAVAGLQALCVYFLLRVSETNDVLTDFDIPLICTMMDFTSRVKGITLRYCNPLMDGPPTWQGWVLVESLRRTLITFFIVGFLFETSVGIQPLPCDSGKHWREMLLPCSRDLWTAQTKSEWEKLLAAQNEHRQPSFGDLLRHNSDGEYSQQSIDRWLGQVDDFGTLVVVVASLVEEMERASSK